MLGFVGTVLVLEACGSEVGPQRVDRVDLRPDSLHLDLGASAVLDVSVRGERGDDVSAEWVPRIEWRVVGPPIVDFEVGSDGRPTLRAVDPGTVAIQAEVGPASAILPVWIPPAGLDTVVLAETPILMSSSEAYAVDFTLLDTLGVPMPTGPFRISASLSDSSLVELPATITFDRINLIGQGRTEVRVEGETTVTLQVNTRVFDFPVTVVAEPIGPREAPVIGTTAEGRVQLIWGREFIAREGYRIDRATSGEGVFATVGRTARDDIFASLDTVWVDSTATSGVRYDYRVHTCSVHGCAVYGSPVVSGVPGG